MQAVMQAVMLQAVIRSWVLGQILCEQDQGRESWLILQNYITAGSN